MGSFVLAQTGRWAHRYSTACLSLCLHCPFLARLLVLLAPASLPYCPCLQKCGKHLSCETLGWPADLHGTGDVCGASSLGESFGDSDGCVRAVEHADATRICDELGARLCTRDELANAEGDPEACGYGDTQFEWSWASDGVRHGCNQSESIGVAAAPGQWFKFTATGAQADVSVRSHSGAATSGLEDIVINGLFDGSSSEPHPGVLLQQGCGADLHLVNPAAPEGTLVSLLCPVSCETCSLSVAQPETCTDDPDGVLVSFGGCAAVVGMGCGTDLHSVNPAAPEGSLVSLLCPVSCEDCPEPVPEPEPEPCADDPGGVLMSFGGCAAVVGMGDHTVIMRYDLSALPSGTVYFLHISGPANELFTVTATSTTSSPEPAAELETCTDDPDGVLVSFGGCAAVVDMGCGTDLHSVNPAAPEGTLVSLLCPVSCEDCPEPVPEPTYSKPENPCANSDTILLQLTTRVATHLELGKPSMPVALDVIQSLCLEDTQLLSAQCCADAHMDCDAARVTALSLSNHGLRGSIPTVMGQLNALRSLRLDRNFLTGSIPTALGKLRLLEELEIQNNQLEMQDAATLSQILGGLGRLKTLAVDMSDEIADLALSIIQPSPPLSCRVGQPCGLSLVTRTHAGTPPSSI
eukprot:SAG22_NODE_319_length_12493_cov_33.326475_1_plen_635_part_00